VKINSASDSSIVQFGDGENTKLKTFAIAVQRAIPNDLGDETRFASYPVFFLPSPQPAGPPGGFLVKAQPDAVIQVGFLTAVAVRSASVVRIGNSGALEAESRIHHIRHFNNLSSAYAFSAPGPPTNAPSLSADAADADAPPEIRDIR
jgi:hypothetical protein